MSHVDVFKIRKSNNPQYVVEGQVAFVPLGVNLYYITIII